MGELDQRINDTDNEEQVTSSQGIELDPETYNALLDRIAELEAISAQQPKQIPQSQPQVELSELDELVEEVRRANQGKSPDQQVDIDQMSNRQLAQFIIQQVNEQGGVRLQQLETTVETLKVIREIDKCEAKYNDFWQFEDRIKQLGVNNPTLSIEQAYKLAKAETPPAKKEEGEGQPVRPTRTERLLKLPSRLPHSEKPGPAAGSMRDSNPAKTLTDAAAKAWDEVVGRDKVVL